MHYALIKENKVHNVIISDEDFNKGISNEWDYIVKIENYNTSGIGVDTEYIDGNFITAVQDSELIEELNEPTSELIEKLNEPTTK